MDQTTDRALPSKGEVAFRFVACTMIALALYYTPELKWSSDASDAATVQADTMPAMSGRDASLEACISPARRSLLIDAAMRAN